jgi:parallel beta-helix repeat protein
MRVQTVSRIRLTGFSQISQIFQITNLITTKMKHYYKTLLLIAAIFTTLLSFGQCGSGIPFYTSGTYNNIPSNSTIEFSGVITLNSNQVITNTTILLAPGSKIVIAPNSDIQFFNSSITECFSSGTTSWEGVELTNATSRIRLFNSTIQDAHVGITSILGGDFTIENSLLKNNQVHVHVRPYGISNNLNHSGSITGTNFETSYANPADACISLKSVKYIDLGTGNTFSNACYGVYSYNSSFDIQDSYLHTMYSAFSLSAPFPLPANYPTFGSNYIGTAIYSFGNSTNNPQNINIIRNIIDKTHQGVHARGNINQIKVIENHIEPDNHHGIQVKEGTDIDIHENFVAGTGTIGILCENLSTGNMTDITNNSMNTINSGIVVQNSNAFNGQQPQVSIRQNGGIFNYVNAIRLFQINNAEVLSNLIQYTNNVAQSNTIIGIKLVNSSNNLISNNNISALGAIAPPTTIGILLDESNFNSVTENYINDCVIGIFDDGNTDNTHQENKLENCTNGLKLSSDFQNVGIYCNNFSSCDIGVKFVQGTNPTLALAIGSQTVGSDNSWVGCATDIHNSSTAVIDWYHKMVPFEYNPITVIGVTLHNDITYPSMNYRPCSPPPARRSLEATQEGNHVYPNPANGQFKIDAENNGELNMYNMVGEHILSQSLSSGTNSVSIDNIPPGIYLCRIVDSIGLQQTERLVIQ